MTQFTVTIGWSKSREIDGRLVSSYDGYDPRLDQHTETIEVEWTNPSTMADAEMLSHLAREVGRSVESVTDEAYGRMIRRNAEAIATSVMLATNSPFPLQPGLAQQIQDRLRDAGYDGRQAHYSLSVGDTVTVDGYRLAVARSGYERVAA